ncbi:MAG: tRNA 2-thiocytidine biosynthesis protein TtcA [Clostridia bacterium]|nr:tRNA 2-thiocytidine biosynthesis protein TtcA [Clostridia bacterium]
MQQILSPMRKAIEEYNMIEEGDKIAVCLSGGKDSITLLNGLKALQRFYPKHFEIIAISINPGFDFFNEELLKDTCNKICVPLFIEYNHAKEIVFDIRNEKNPCSLCANLRRGIINSIAIRENCNKIALGHNKDDVLETFLLNLLYTGTISTFAPISYMDRSRITLIRPLVLTDEKDIKRYIKRSNIEVMKKVCPMDGKSKREEIKSQIISWQKDIPMIRANLFGAITRNIPEWKIDTK